MSSGSSRRPPAPVADLTWESVLAWRMERQQLAERAPREEMLDVVSRICGLHAQLMSSGELTLWARVDALERDAVQRALWEEKTLVKTWAMRGTLHLLAAAELPLWVAGQGTLKPRHHSNAWLKAFGLTREQADAVLAAIPAALEEGPLTREELARAVGERTGSEELGDKLRESWGVLLKPAAFRGDLCFAPGDGQKVRFTAPSRWLGGGEDVGVEEATRVIARRYLAVNGPATREQFARWFGTPSAAQAGRMLAAVGDELAPVAIEGEPALALVADLPALEAARPSGRVRLLPAFDQYVVAAPRDSEAVVPSARRRLVYRPQGWLSPVLVVDGRIVGVWRHGRTRDALSVEIDPFEPLPAEVREPAELEAERLASFLGTPDGALTWASPLPPP